MGVFDQAARYAARADAAAVTRRVLQESGVSLTFREWLDTRALPKPGGRDRTADLVAAMDDPAAPAAPWLVVLEFQAQPDEDKLDVTLEEVANLRGHVRHGAERAGKYKVIAGLIYLTGQCPESVTDMTTPNGKGTRHEALVWNLASDDAAQALDRVTSGELSWGMLFWVPLMAGGGDGTVIERWGEIVIAMVNDLVRRGQLVETALIFAELTRRVPEWRKVMETIKFTESEVVNEWMTRGALKERRRHLIKVIDVRFPGNLSPEFRQMINEQESPGLLDEWVQASLEATTFEQILAVLKR